MRADGRRYDRGVSELCTAASLYSFDVLIALSFIQWNSEDRNRLLGLGGRNHVTLSSGVVAIGRRSNNYEVN
jgi:hypothetical protein